MSDADFAELKISIRKFIASLGEDPDRDGLVDTPQRFIKQLQECLSGYQDDPEKHIKVFTADGYRGLITVSDISFSSICEHHLVPFTGTISIAYVPSNKILGLSKFARLTDTLSRRLQVQERLTKQLTDVLIKQLEPELLIVKVNAKHMCMAARGVRRLNSITETVSVHGDTKANAHFIEQFYTEKTGV